MRTVHRRPPSSRLIHFRDDIEPLPAVRIVALEFVGLWFSDIHFTADHEGRVKSVAEPRIASGVAVSQGKVGMRAYSCLDNTSFALSASAYSDERILTQPVLFRQHFTHDEHVLAYPAHALLV